MVSSLDPRKRNNVTVAGNPGAEQTLVFVHGFGTDQRAWRDVAAAFMDDYKVVLFDNVGAGQADPEAFVQHHYLNLHRYALDLLEVCAALQLERPVLIGHSAGAMSCVLAAIEAPERFSRLALIGASPRYLDEAGYRGGFSKDDIDAVYSAVSGGYAAWAEAFAPLAMGNADQPRLIAQFANALKAIPPERALTVLCSIFQSDHRADVRKLSLPTLLIQAREDVAVPLEVAEYLQRNIRGSLLKVIEATGHLPHITAPSKVIAALYEFVRGERAPRPD